MPDICKKMNVIVKGFQILYVRMLHVYAHFCSIKFDGFLNGMRDYNRQSLVKSNYM
jgi:hypothetical protein